MKKNTTTPVPHDTLFKTFLTHPETARDFLDIHLPPALREVCDLSTLRLESGSFIEEDLRVYFADVLYSLKTARGEGFVYCLVEHQSSQDRHIAFRIMRYAIAAMQRHLDSGHEQLPLVIPVLFCHGRASPWTCAMNWTELFSEPEIARQLYTGDFPLVDVGALDDNDIMTHRRMAMLELLLKHARTRDLAELTEQLVTLLLSGYTDNERLTTLLNWMLQTGDTTEPQAFLQELARRSPDYEDTLMTIAQKLEQKGRTEGRMEGRTEGIEIGEQRGIERGMQLGEQKGRKEEALKIAITMLQSGLDRATVMNITGLSSEELKQLRH